MESSDPLPLPADPTLASIAAGYDAAGACAVFFDAEFFFVHATREFLKWDAHRLMPTEPPENWFGPAVTAYMEQAFGRGFSRRHEFMKYGPGVPRQSRRAHPRSPENRAESPLVGLALMSYVATRALVA